MTGTRVNNRGPCQDAQRNGAPLPSPGAPLRIGRRAAAASATPLSSPGSSHWRRRGQSGSGAAKSSDRPRWGLQEASECALDEGSLLESRDAVVGVAFQVDEIAVAAPGRLPRERRCRHQTALHEARVGRSAWVILAMPVSDLVWIRTVVSSLHEKEEALRDLDIGRGLGTP